MARIIGGGMVGALAGKLGSTVFARNKSGQYVRQYVKPTNANTGIQNGNRSRFSSAASGFASLTGTIRGNWNSFALSNFRPKNATNTGQFSGLNAYASLRTVILSAMPRAGLTGVDVNGTPVSPLPAINPFIPANVPPNLSINANVKGATEADTVPVASIDATVLNTFAGNIELKFDKVGADYPNFDGWVDANSKQIGLMVYMSNPVSFPGKAFSNPEKYLLWAIPNVALLNTDLLLVESIKFTMNSQINSIIYKSLPAGGQYVRITAYFVDVKSGTLIKIGVKDNVVIGF